MLNALVDIARRAGKLMLAAKVPEVITKEGHFNFVTQTDLQVQEYLRVELENLLPGSGFFAEEKEDNRLTEAPTWVVDPIDGTTNFMRGRGCSAVSVALLRERVPVLGVVYNPFSGELFSAEKGKGAHLNGKPIRVSDQPMDKALVTFGTAPYNQELALLSLRMAYAFLQKSGDLRRSGSAALDLCFVACGRSEFYFELLVSPWDYAAGALLVSEAGGQVHQPLDPDFRYDRAGCLLASNPPCLEDAIAIIRETASDKTQAL